MGDDLKSWISVLTKDTHRFALLTKQNLFSYRESKLSCDRSLNPQWLLGLIISSLTNIYYKIISFPGPPGWKSLRNSVAGDI